MNKVRVPFPKYLNSKKLFYIWEYDVVLVSAMTGGILFIMLLWLSVPVIYSLFIAMGTTYFVLKRYIKYFKKAREGFVWHLLYSKGFITPVDKSKIKKDFELSLLPYGFENEFVN
ncbi:hypothetical protein [Sulfurimonas sp.]|uniref:hypothetical protein n=1 Tax=Sulfurimonas sp. TaxID=2022749 RepID=UPI0025E29AB1|nr:hypothetical protein [Sulfurimonas sp.]